MRSINLKLFFSVFIFYLLTYYNFLIVISTCSFTIKMQAGTVSSADKQLVTVATISK